MDAAGLLRTYKGQYGVESDFAFLKDPLVVNDLFLKTPSRIDALGMVLIIALMIWRLMERTMRAYVENSKTRLPGWDNRTTDKPTTFMMTIAMTGIMVAVIGTTRPPGSFSRRRNSRGCFLSDRCYKYDSLPPGRTGRHG
ncbi:MAG: hypothetical protein WCQ50_09315 [Spirochaetota bacterium]